MSRRHPITLAGLVFTLGWLAPLAMRDAAAQKIYRWTDKSGKIHFSNIGPGEATETNEEPAPSRAPEMGIVREAPTDRTEPAPRAAPTPEEGKGQYASLSEEQFSARVTEKRLRLKREILDARRRISDIDQELARIRETRNRTLEQAMDLAGVASPEKPDSPDEGDLKKEREKAQKRIEAVNNEYAELRDEAVRRFGHQPPWWLPLE